MKFGKRISMILTALFFLFATTGSPVLAQVINDSNLYGTYYAAEVKDKNDGQIHTSFKRLVSNGAGIYTYEQILPVASSGSVFYTTWWGDGKVSVKVNEESPFGDAKGAVSTDGNYLVLADTVFVSNNGMPDLLFAIRESSSLTDEVMSGSYNLFIFYQTPGAEGPLVGTNGGTFHADIETPRTLSGQFTETTIPFTSVAQPLTGDYEAAFTVASNGQLTLDLTSGASIDILDQMQGMISGDGNIFVAVETSTADNTQAFIIGIRQGEAALTLQDLAGNYYLDDFGYYPFDEDGLHNDAASFLSIYTVLNNGAFSFIESDTSCDDCPCQDCPTKGETINGTFVVSPSGNQYTATITGYPEGRKQGGQINLSPAGNVFTIIAPLYLGIGIEQASGTAEPGEPVANAGDDQTASGGDTVALNGSGSTDSDGTIVSYRWLPISGESALIQAITLSDSTAGQPTFTAPMASGAVTFRLIVTDNEGKSASDTVTITVTASNNPPNADAGPDQTVNEGNTVTLDGSGSSDTDDGIGAYTWEQTGGPAITLSDVNAVQPTFVAPAVDDQTALSFTLTVADLSAITDSDSVTITVNNVSIVNQPPTANAGSDQTANEGNTVTLNGTGSIDPDDGISTFTWEQTGGPAVTLSDANASQPTFTAPAVDAQTALEFTLTVADIAGATATDTVTVTVNDASGINQIPTANAGTDKMVVPGALVTLDGSASTDPDDGIKTYTWTQTAGLPVVTLTGANLQNPTFTAPSVGEQTTLTFQLLVEDNGGLSGVDTVDVIIDPDTNGNGMPDMLESTDSDLDGDGIADFNDPDSIRFSNINGDGFVGFFTESGTLTQVRNISDTDGDVPQNNKPEGSFPYGVFSYTITGLTPGATVAVTFVFPEALDEDAAFFKIDENGWREIASERSGNDKLIVALTDGNPLTDADGLVNGIIVDPSTVVIPDDNNNDDDDDDDDDSCFIRTLTN